MVTHEDWQAEALAEAQAECDRDNPVVRNITYHRFVSKSKGRRNGKQRIRRRARISAMSAMSGRYYLPGWECRGDSDPRISLH